MKISTLLLYLGTALILMLPAHARTWTSADGSKSFEAEYIRHNEETVTIMRGLKMVSFKLSLLSEADREWLRQKEVQKTQPAEAPEASKDQLGKFGNSISRKLVMFSGKRYSRYKLESAPDYYLLYFSASW